MLAGPHPRSLSPFDVAQGDPELVEGSRGDFAPRSGRRRSRCRTVFIDLETTGLSGGAGTVAFLVGCGFYDLGAFQVRQFLLTSYSAERALLTAVAEFFDDAELIVSYNGKTFDVPVMETRWQFHRMQMPLEDVPHFDALHTARRLWKPRGEDQMDGGCRLSTLERTLFDVRRVGDVPGFEIPSRFFHFMRTGDPRPLEPVLEHNRLDLVSLAAVTARAVRLVEEGADGCSDGPEALAVGRIYERAGLADRAVGCYRRASTSDSVEVRCESLYRLGLRCRRERRFSEAAARWREIVSLTEPRSVRRNTTAAALRQFAVEALAIHHEHRDVDLDAARELALFALKEDREVGRDSRRADGYRHRLARLERKLEKRDDARKLDARKFAGKENAQLFWS
jgi:tetratricopeptide (TPR) repeat protein